MTRRGRQGSFVENAAGVYVLFPLGTSRALDPQLHIHAVAINLCRRKDGTTGTIRSRDLYWHKMAAGALFRAELAHLLATELGLTIIPDGWKFKIDGIPESLCEEFSKRRKVIEELAREGGWSSPEVLAQLAITSRQAKKNVPLAECFAQWAATGDKHGFTREAALALLAAGEKKLAAQASGMTHGESQLTRFGSGHIAASAGDKEAALIDAFLKSVDALAGFKSHFPERDLVRESATRALACGASVTEILDTVKKGVRRFENRIDIKDSNYASYSTKQNIAAEKELLEQAYQGVKSTKHIAQQESVLRAIAQGERKLTRQLGIPIAFTEDQKEAILHITLEPGDTKLAQGCAGAGKTQMLDAAQAAWNASGFRVLGAAITGRAALGLEKSTGIPSVTIESLLRRLRPNLTAEDFVKLFAWHSKSAIKSVYYEGIRAGRWMCNPLKQAGREAVAGVAKRLWETTRSAKLPDCQLTEKTILVVDEAAMLPTKVLLALQQECNHAGTKLVLVGDALQLPPIEAGGPFQSLVSRIGHRSLTTNVRQKQPWMREATSLLIANEPQQALERYAANGALHLARHHRAAMEKLIADYGNLPEQKFAKATVETSFVLIGDKMLSKERAFTQLTRASHESTVYAAEAGYGDAMKQLAQQISKKTAKDLANDHEVVRQPQTRIKQRQTLLQEAAQRLLPLNSASLANPTAGLSAVTLTTTHVGALWKLVADYSELRGHDYQSTLAVVTDAREAAKINLLLQQRRRANQELGVDSLLLPNGEHVFRATVSSSPWKTSTGCQ